MPVKKILSDRANSKYVLIAENIRQGILTGELPPGTLLPRREKLARKYNTTFATLQRAINTLLTDGFLTAKGRVGTHVADNPPHLTHYGLVFPYVTGQMQHLTRFWNAIRDEAVHHAKAYNCRVSVYYSGADDASSFDYQDLNRDIAAHRLAGLIFTMHPDMLKGSPAADDLTLPRVAIAQGQLTKNIQGFVWFDTQQLIEKALGYMSSCGKKKVAIISLAPEPSHENNNTSILSSVRKYRIQCPEHWIFNCPINYPVCARQFSQLLVSLPSKERPDGLIITDESFVDECLYGLHSAGIRPGHDIEVLAHISFGRHNPAQSGVKRIGYDMRETFAQCIKLIDQSRAGRKIKPIAPIPALFEEELNRNEFNHL